MMKVGHMAVFLFPKATVDTVLVTVGVLNREHQSEPPRQDQKVWKIA